ncbi:MAG TPA: oligosaccharide flippase family protein, partial [Patescibacteria group bacterium]|nr:oligosaccharide flippase family protein [Patescibacteria group bacterium]
MRLSTKVAYNTVIQIISKVVITGLGLVVVAILTRYLGQSGFGQYTTIMSFLSLFSVAGDLGLTLLTAQMISRPDVDNQKALNNLFGLRFFSALAFLAL